jgi:D-alanine transaminase
VRQRSVRLAEVAELDEMFITSSTREIMPVARVDGTLISRGGAGPLTRLLRQRYQASTRDSCDSG